MSALVCCLNSVFSGDAAPFVLRRILIEADPTSGKLAVENRGDSSTLTAHSASVNNRAFGRCSLMVRLRMSGTANPEDDDRFGSESQ